MKKYCVNLGNTRKQHCGTADGDVKAWQKYNPIPTSLRPKASVEISLNLASLLSSLEICSTGKWTRRPIAKKREKIQLVPWRRPGPYSWFPEKHTWCLLNSSNPDEVLQLPNSSGWPAGRNTEQSSDFRTFPLKYYGGIWRAIHCQTQKPRLAGKLLIHEKQKLNLREQSPRCVH